MARKRVKILVLVTVNIAILVILELGLRLAGFSPPSRRSDPFRGFFGNYRVYGTEQPSGLGTYYRTNPNKLHTFQLEYFTARKKEGAVRVFCLGGSTVNGGVYRETYVRALKLLAAGDEWGRRLEIVNAGGNGYDSAQIIHLSRELARYRPEALIILSGHNEFSSLRYHRDLLSQGAAVRKLRVFLDLFRVTHLLRRLVGEAKKTGMTFDIEPPGGPVTETERDHILARMKNNLRQVAALGRQHGFHVILAAPAANLRYPPVGKEGSAAALFAQAEEELKAGLADKARQSYCEAWIGDSVPKRIVPAQTEVIKQVAADTGCRIIDFQPIFKQAATDAIPGDSLFLDFCHPNFEGNIIMARSLFKLLKTLDFPGRPDSAAETGIMAGTGAGGTSPEIIESRIKNGSPAESLAASVELAGAPGRPRFEPVIDRFRNSRSLVFKKMLLERLGRASPLIVPLLIETLNTRHFAFDARQALLTVTGQYFGLRSYRVSRAVDQWKKWWRSGVIDRRRLLLRKNLQSVAARLNSDDLNVRLASITILEELTGETLEFDPLALESERTSACNRWKIWSEELNSGSSQ